MKRQILILSVCAICLLGIGLGAKRALDVSRRLPNHPDANGAITLPNGWRITPAGAAIPLPGDLPMKMHVTSDGRSLIVNTGGFHDHSVSVIDLKTKKSAATLDVIKNWGGMAFDAASGTIFLSGGGHPMRGFAEALERRGVSSPMKASLESPILRVRYADGKLEPAAPLAIAGLNEKDRYISGITLSPDGALLVLNIQTDTLYRLEGPDFTKQTSAKTGYRPYSSVVSPDAKSLAVSNWGDESVSFFDPATLRETSRINVGSHPNEMVWAQDGRLFVANSGSNTVSVIASGKVTETISTSLDPKAPIGSTPDALVLSPDQKRLFVANADNNNVAVVDIAVKESRIAGFIPTGWYPTALAISPDSRQLFVGTGKGMGFRNNFPASAPAPPRKTPNPETPYDYIGDVLSGHVSIVDMPDAKQLAVYTKRPSPTCPSPLRRSIPRSPPASRRKSSQRSNTSFMSFAKTARTIRFSATSRLAMEIPDSSCSAKRSRPTPTHLPESLSPSTIFTAMAKSPKTATSGQTPPTRPTSTRKPGPTATAAAPKSKPMSAS